MNQLHYIPVMHLLALGLPPTSRCPLPVSTPIRKTPAGWTANHKFIKEIKEYFICRKKEYY